MSKVPFRLLELPAFLQVCQIFLCMKLVGQEFKVKGMLFALSQKTAHMVVEHGLLVTGTKQVFQKAQEKSSTLWPSV